MAFYSWMSHMYSNSRGKASRVRPPILTFTPMRRAFSPTPQLDLLCRLHPSQGELQRRPENGHKLLTALRQVEPQPPLVLDGVVNVVPQSVLERVGRGKAVAVTEVVAAVDRLAGTCAVLHV